MDSRDIFRRFFGFPNRHPSASGLDDHDHDEERSPRHNRVDDGFSFFFDSSRGLEGMFEHFHGDLWHQMEALHRQMEEMMRGFGAIDFPSPFDQPQLRSLDPDGDSKHEQPGKSFIWSNIPSPFFKQQEKSPRDFMLKDGVDEHVPAATPVLPAPPAGDGRSEFGSGTLVPRWNLPGTLNKEDTDLDGKISEDKLLELIKRPQRDIPSETHPRVDKPGFFSSKKYVSVTTIRGPNNKVEFKRTVKDSSGQEESTVTRSVGDKSYTVTTVTESDGTQKQFETFKNMDEGDVSKFEEEWSRKQKPQPTTPADSMLSPRLDTHDRSLFSKLFNWKG